MWEIFCFRSWWGRGLGFNFTIDYLMEVIIWLSIILIAWFLIHSLYKEIVWVDSRLTFDFWEASQIRHKKSLEVVIKLVATFLVAPFLLYQLILNFIPIFIGKGLDSFFILIRENHIYWKAIYIISLVIYIYIIKALIDKKNAHNFLSSVMEIHEITRSPFKRIPVNVSAVDSDRIKTYPRITIQDQTINEIDKSIIFDSSDFFAVNNSLGIIKDYNYQTFSCGSVIKIDGVNYVTNDVRVEFIDFFDDYKLCAHTSAYKGKDIPYNIQIRVFVSPT